MRSTVRTLTAARVSFGRSCFHAEANVSGRGLETLAKDEERVRRCSLSRPLLSPSGSGSIVCPWAGQPDSERSSWSSIASLHRPTGHTWPEVICCLSRRGLRVSRSSAAMQTTQYADLQRFFALRSSVSDRAAAARLLPESAMPRLSRQQNLPICRQFERRERRDSNPRPPA